MTTDITPALLTLWDALAAKSVQKIERITQQDKCGFYTGVKFGMETARDE